MSEPEPSGSLRREVNGVVPGEHTGIGHRRGMSARPEPLLGEFALRLGLLEALPVRQHHRAERGGDQQRAGQLERPQVAGEDQRRKTLDVAVGVGLGQPA